MLEIRNRPRALTGLLTRNGTRPTRVARRLHEHRDIDLLAYQVVQRVQTLHHNQRGGLDLQLPHARMHLEAPLRDSRRAPRTKFCKVKRKSRKI